MIHLLYLIHQLSLLALIHNHCSVHVDNVIIHLCRDSITKQWINGHWLSWKQWITWAMVVMETWIMWTIGCHMPNGLGEQWLSWKQWIR